MRVGPGTRGLEACIVVLLCATSAEAQTLSPGRPETGREWLVRCGERVADDAAAPQTSGAGACVAWIEGLIDINEIYRGLGALEKTSEGFCTPPGATLVEAARAVVRYFHAHPAAMHFSARMLAYMALREAFPCTPPI